MVTIGKLTICMVLLTILTNAGISSAGTAEVSQGDKLTKEERIFGLTTVYAAAKQHFAYFEQVPKLDWDKAFMQFLPEVEKEQPLADYYLTLMRFVALLEDGHTNVGFPRNVQEQLDCLPVVLNIIEDKWIVKERYPTDEILAEDIPPGSIVISINGMSPAEHYAKTFYPYVPGGERMKLALLEKNAYYPKGSEVSLELKYPDGSTHSRKLRANRTDSKRTADLLEKYFLPFRRLPLFFSKELPGDIVYIRYGACNSECNDSFMELFSSMKSKWPKAVIFDLRNNGGGNTPEFIPYLINEPIAECRRDCRWSVAYASARLQGITNATMANLGFKMWLKSNGLGEVSKRVTLEWLELAGKDSRIMPADVHYDGKIVILTDANTASAAEDFVVPLQCAKRATVIGEPTYGSTGQPIYYNLPGGGWLSICTVKTKYPDGREFIDVGCQPDIPVNRTIKAIVEGRDEVMDAALRFLEQSK